MISIQSIMLIALGFLSAVLLALLIAPAFWKRAVRLTTQRLKERLPQTEAEIKADKDRLRAEYAIRVHKLEMKVEESDLRRARNVIEINRRDGLISQLEHERVGLRAVVDENQNARHVLEQTVSDRMPKIELRLNEARTLLFSRDREIAELTHSTKRQHVALDEAASINAQQTAELERLSNALTVRGARNQQTMVDPSFEGELALRAEIEALRSKTREQAGLIGRLQAQSGRGAMLALSNGDGDKASPRALNGGGLNGVGHNGTGHNSAGLNGAGRDLALSTPVGVDEARAASERDVRGLRAKLDDQNAELARMGAELQTLKDVGETTGLRDSKIALKARLNAAIAQGESQTDTIKRLRAELAAANERLALQGAHFMDQMRRLGAGSLPAAGQQRRPVTQGAKVTLAERVAQSRSPLTSVSPTVRAQETSGTTSVALSETVPSPSTSLPAAVVLPSMPTPGATAAKGAANAAIGLQATEAIEVGPATASGAANLGEAPRRPRLIDRISSINKG